MTKQIVIIGNGIAGISAARHIRKLSNHPITVISAESKYFFSRTALMYVFMGHMKMEHTQPYENFFWQKNKIDLLQKFVTHVDRKSKCVVFDDGAKLSYDALIIASGSVPNKYGWPGENLNGVQGLYSLQDLQLLEKNAPTAKRAVIVGGGLIGIEAAEMLRSRNIEVTFLVREKLFWNNVLPQQESQMISNHIKQHHVDLRLQTELQEICDDGNGNVNAIVTKGGERINCEIVLLTAGVRPNIDYIRSSDIATNKGILVNDYLQTNMEDIYAIGDCAEVANPCDGRRKIEPVWYTGKLMGEVVAHTICGEPMKYNPGIWFNSAKFFDIEYQTYGSVPSILPDNMDWFYWQHPTQNKSVRISFDKNTKAVLGFNYLGLRARHQVCDEWIKSKTKIDDVVNNLSMANFDPEFSRKHESEIREAFANSEKQLSQTPHAI